MRFVKEGNCYILINKIRKSQLYLLLIIFILISCWLFSGVYASSNGILEISLSIVEDDPFNPGDTFHIIAEIRNREPEGRIDVIVKYDILDLNEKVVFYIGSKTVAVETISSFNEEISLPSWITEGNYIIRGNVSTLNGTYWHERNSPQFSIINVPTELDERDYLTYIMLIALIITGGGLIFEHRRVSKMRVSGEDLKKFIKKRK